jgi:hypothetical protein
MFLSFDYNIIANIFKSFIISLAVQLSQENFQLLLMLDSGQLLVPIATYTCVLRHASFCFILTVGISSQLSFSGRAKSSVTEAQLT